jgi:hypothetical protein
MCACVQVLVQHFSMQHPALKNVVLPRGIEGNSRRWLARHSDVFELSPLDKDGQSTVRIKQGADAIIEARKQQQQLQQGAAGAKPPEAIEREAVDVLVGMLRKLGGGQVISVLVQYFSMEHPALKNEVMPRGMAGGPRRWFQEVRTNHGSGQRQAAAALSLRTYASARHFVPPDLFVPPACIVLCSAHLIGVARGHLRRGPAGSGWPDASWSPEPPAKQAWLRLNPRDTAPSLPPSFSPRPSIFGVVAGRRKPVASAACRALAELS